MFRNKYEILTGLPPFDYTTLPPGFVPKQERFYYEQNSRKVFNIRDQEGFIYNKNSGQSQGWQQNRWTCQKRNSRNCKVIVKTYGEFIVAKKNDHICY